MMDNPGETAERNYRRKKLLILAVCIVLSGLGSVVMMMTGNENVIYPVDLGPGWDLSLVARIAVFVVLFGTVSLVARWKWLASDEVRRSYMLSFWAATGWSLGATFLAFLMFGRDIPEADRLHLAFLVPISMGLLFTIARWLRDGFVW